MKPKTPKTSDPLALGVNVFIRTVTHYYTGRVALIFEDAVILEDAAWIASTGGFHTALKTGTLDEVEPFEDPVRIARGAIVDVTFWAHALPREQR